MFCGNESAVDHSTNIYFSLINKPSNLAYNYVQLNIASGVMRVYWISMGENLVDTLMKQLIENHHDIYF